MAGANGNGNGIPQKDKGYFWIEDSVVDRYGATIGPLGLAVYAVLARHANAAGESYWPKARLAGKLGCSKRTVDQGIKLLQAAGLVRVDRRVLDGGKTIANLYTVLAVPGIAQEIVENPVPEALNSPSLCSPLMCIPLGADSAPLNVQILHPSPANSAPLNGIFDVRGANSAPLEFKVDGAADSPPCAKLTHGEPFADWPTVRERFVGRLPQIVGDTIDQGRVFLNDGRIVIALDGADRVHWVRDYQGDIAGIAQRVTKVARPVEFVNTQAGV